VPILNGGQAVGVGLTIVLLFVYYAVMSTARALGSSGALSPVLAAWAPNLLFVAAGVLLVIREEGWMREAKPVLLPQPD